MSDPFCCPSCGTSLERRLDPRRLFDVLPITGVRRAVLRVMFQHFAREVSGDLIADCIYADRVDGGPLGARDVVKTHIYHLRKLLQPYGLTIVGRQTGHFRLDWSDAPALQGVAA